MFVAFGIFVDVHAVFEFGFVGCNDFRAVCHFHNVLVGTAGESYCRRNEEE